MLVAHRMLEFYAVGLQRYATVRVAALVAIFQVTFYRAPHGRQLHAYLVLTARLQIHFKQIITRSRGSFANLTLNV